MITRVRAKQFEESIESTSLQAGDKAKVLAAFNQALKPLESDNWIYRIVVGSLGLAILFCLTFSFVLVLKSNSAAVKIPEIFMAIGSAAVGALAGLLAPSPAR